MPRDVRRLPERVIMQVIACGMAALTASIAPVAMGSNLKTPDPQKAVAAQQQAAPTIDVTVRRIELQSLLGDRAQLIAELEVMPHMDAVLRTVRIRSLRLDDKTPVYMEPLEGEYTLQSGRPLVLPNVRLAVFYADFPSPATLDRMLAAHHVEVAGEVRAGLQLSLLAKLMTRDLHPVVALRVRQSVPFTESAVDSPTQLGVAVLAVAERALGASASVAERVTGVRVQVEMNPVSEAERSGTVLVRTTYRLGSKSAVTEHRCERLGFWVDAEHVIVPAEVLTPWAYSIEAAEAIASGPASVDNTSVVTVVNFAISAPTGTQGGWAPLPQPFNVERQGHPRSVRLLLPSGQPVSVLERESVENYALLRFDGGSSRPAIASSAETAEVSVLRRGSDADQPLRRLLLSDGQLLTRPTLPRPVDESVFGSPVRVNGTVVGMVAGETTWVPLPDASASAVRVLGAGFGKSRALAQAAPP